MLCIEGQIQEVTRIMNIKFPDIVRNVFTLKEKLIWEIKEAKTKARKNNGKRPSLIQRRNENEIKKRRISSDCAGRPQKANCCVQSE